MQVASPQDVVALEMLVVELELARAVSLSEKTATPRAADLAEPDVAPRAVVSAERLT